MTEAFSAKGFGKLAATALANLLVIAILLCPSMFAQTDTFIAGTGVWSEKGNWSLDAVPGQGNDCVLPANSVVTSDLAGVCANFTLAIGGSLTVSPGYRFVYGSSFTNQAAISVGSSNGLDFAQPSITDNDLGRRNDYAHECERNFHRRPEHGHQLRQHDSGPELHGFFNQFWREVCIS